MNITNNLSNSGATFAAPNYIPEEFYKGSNISGVTICIQTLASEDLEEISITFFSSRLSFNGSAIYWGDGEITKLPVTGDITHTYKRPISGVWGRYSIYIKDCTILTSPLVDTNNKFFDSNQIVITAIYLGNGVELSENIFAGVSGLTELYNVNANNLSLFGGDKGEHKTPMLRRMTFSPVTKIIKDDFLKLIDSYGFTCKCFDSLSFMNYIGNNAFQTVTGSYPTPSATEILNLSSAKYIGSNAFGIGANKFKTVLLGQKEIQLGNNCFDTAMLSQNDFKCLYCGTPTEWATLATGNGKTSALTAKTYYYFEEYPGEGIKAWHYVNGVPTIW